MSAYQTDWFINACLVAESNIYLGCYFSRWLLWRKNKIAAHPCTWYSRLVGLLLFSKWCPVDYDKIILMAARYSNFPPWNHWSSDNALCERPASITPWARHKSLFYRHPVFPPGIPRSGGIRRKTVNGCRLRLVPDAQFYENQWAPDEKDKKVMFSVLNRRNLKLFHHRVSGSPPVKKPATTVKVQEKRIRLWNKLFA